jgi:hypothetical protein
MKGDLIQQNNIVSKIDQVNWNHPPTRLEIKSTRGHNSKRMECTFIRSNKSKISQLIQSKNRQEIQ